MVEMLKCIYGHPESGKRFIESLMSCLKRKGWKSANCDQAFLRRVGDVIGTYVDDIMSCGENVENVWKEIEEKD